MFNFCIIFYQNLGEKYEEKHGVSDAFCYSLMVTVLNHHLIEVIHLVNYGA